MSGAFINWNATTQPGMTVEKNMDWLGHQLVFCLIQGFGKVSVPLFQHAVKFRFIKIDTDNPSSNPA